MRIDKAGAMPASRPSRRAQARCIPLVQNERGICASDETVRFWWHRFRPMFADEIRRKHVNRKRAFANWRCHLDEVFVKTKGERH